MKIIIVDDEKMIRDGLEMVVPWQQIGIREVYTAGDAAEALSRIEAVRPQIMITDLNMPEVDGLSLIEQARKILPELRIIVLTGYERFDYARECLNLNVQDFLLKPIDEELLVETVRKQIESIRQEHSSDLAIASLKRFELEQAVLSFLHERTQSLAEKMPSTLVTADSYQIALISPGSGSQTAEDREYYLQSMKNICISVVDARSQGLTMVDEASRIAVLLWFTGRNADAVKAVEEMTDLLKIEYSGRFKSALGSVVSSPEQIRISYNDAKLLLQDTAAYEKLPVVQNTSKQNNLFYDVFAEMKKAMCRSISNTDYVIRIYSSFCQAIEAYGISFREAKTCCYELVSGVYFTYMDECGGQPDGRLEKYMTGIGHAQLEEILDLTKAFLLELLENREENNVHEAIVYAKNYILEHLEDDLSVGEIAGMLYLTPNYFSRLFKHDTGIGCNEFIVQERIRRAKNLLEITNLKANRIAGMVGYKDTNYFSLAFKKNVGMSPKNYREQFRKQTGDVSEK